MVLFEQVMREYMDYSDIDTIHAIAEASNDQNQMLVALTSKLYDLIVAKADKIDFSTIARSRGDITKIEKYDQLMECLNIIRNIVVMYKEDTKSVDTVLTAIDNLKVRTALFKKAFVVGSPIPMLMYNTIAMGIAYSVSFLISVCIEYVKDPGSETFNMALDAVAYQKTAQNLMFTNLEAFNTACKSGEMDKTLTILLNQAKVKKESTVEVKPDSPFLSQEDIENGVVVHDGDCEDNDSEIKTESIVGTIGTVVTIASIVGTALLFLAKFAIPIIRNIVYFLYHSTQRISDYWAVQANLLEMNAYQLQYNDTIDVERKNQIINKQLKIAAKWRNRSNKWSVDYTISKKNAEKTSADEAKKYVVSDLNYNQNKKFEPVDSSIF